MDKLIDVGPDPKCASAIGIISQSRAATGEWLRAREGGREVGRAGGKLAKNGSKCWHCRRPLVDANRV